MTIVHKGVARSQIASSSATAAYGLLILLGIYYLIHYLDYANVSLAQLVWNTVIYLTPSSFLALVDKDFRNDEAESPDGGLPSQAYARKSNAMRRFLGLDTPGILTNLQCTRALSDIEGVSGGISTKGPPGLGNWDHSCYQNSVIQGLASLETLREYLSGPGTSGGTTADEEGKERPTTVALKKLLGELNDPKSMGKTLWTSGALKSMSSWQQQDAQEYFSKLVDGLEVDLERLKSREARREGLELLCASDCEDNYIDGDSAPPDQRTTHVANELQAIKEKLPLEGLLAQRVGCQQCGYVEGLSLVPFNCLTVPLGNQQAYDVRECLDEYTALEPINGVECNRCTILQANTRIERMVSQMVQGNHHDDNDAFNPQRKALQEECLEKLDILRRTLDNADYTDTVLKRCQIPANQYVSTTKSRQAVIARAPKALVVHVNRSVFDERTGQQSKNHAAVNFPFRLDLGRWCLGHQHLEGVGYESYESWNTDPKTSMLPKEDSGRGLDHDSSGRIMSNVEFELRAIVTHYGRHENGHYICYRKSPSTIHNHDDRIDGEAVEQSSQWWRLSDEEVTQVGEETVLSQGGVFMLFYERLSATTDGKAPLDDHSLHCEVVDKAAIMHPGGVNDIDSASADQVAAKTSDATKSNVESSRLMSEIFPSPNLENQPAVAEAGQTSIDLPAAEKYNSTAGFSASLELPGTRFQNLGPVRDVAVKVSTSQENARSSSPSKVISPRTGRGKGRRPGKAMESMAGFVQAN